MMLRLRTRILLLLSIVLAGILHGVAIRSLDGSARPHELREIDAVLPLPAQMILAGGDRYLASNVASIRALMANTQNMDREELRLLARVHEDASRFNPANEDNYYVTANILPWHGEYAVTQRILQAASTARPFDWHPMFYYAFDLWYFKHQSIEASSWLYLASKRTPDENLRNSLETVAVRWAEQGYDTNTAIAMLDVVAGKARSYALRKYYQVRRQRLEGLRMLEQAVVRYRQRTGHAPVSLQALVLAGEIKAVPVDPFKFGYGLDEEGNPILYNRPPPSSAVGQ